MFDQVMADDNGECFLLTVYTYYLGFSHILYTWCLGTKRTLDFFANKLLQFRNTVILTAVDEGNMTCYDAYVSDTAERSGVKQIDDWLCPAPYRQTGTSTRRRSGLPATAAVDRLATGQRHRSTTGDKVKNGVGERDDENDDGLTIDLLLITLGVLLALLIVVGLASYCRAVRS